MKPNVNNTDRIIRLLIGVLGVIMIVTNMVTGTWLIVTGVISVIMLVTSAVKFCPLYKLLGISTFRR